MEAEMTETVYGTPGDDSHVMSEKVQSLASSVYSEFERMIKKYDEDVVKELMPLLVGILENLDQAYQEKQENEVDLELLRDDNEQLLTQYEREKQLRKTAEQKNLELEDVFEEERKEMTGKLESLESIVRMFELKAKNAQDHIVRLEDKEAEMKKEYTKLHERYTELFKTHMDYIERTKLLMGPERMLESGNSPRGQKGGLQLPNLRPVNPAIYNSGDTPTKGAMSPSTEYGGMTPSRGADTSINLKQEFRDLTEPESKTTDVGQTTDVVTVSDRGTATSSKTQDSTAQEKSSETRTDNRSPKTAAIPKENSNAGASKIDNTVKSSKTSATPEVTVTETRKDITNVSETGVTSSSDINATASKAQCDNSAQNYETGSDTQDDINHSFEGEFEGDMLPTPDMEEFDDTGYPAKNSNSAANNSSIFEELQAQDNDALGEMDDGVDITGRVINPGDFASSGMSKEVENLILENTELLATKNALNVVKDDLIAKVDELGSEQEMLKEEINSLQAVKEKLNKRISELEEDLKRSREDLETAKEKAEKADKSGDQDDVPMAQRKRFTRVEMARVLMERNQYKERLMELQEAVRWTEMIRASREHPELANTNKKKGSIWNFFSNLFSSSEKPKKKSGLPQTTMKYNAPKASLRPTGDPNKKNRDAYNLGEKAKAYEFLQEDLLTEKSRKERQKERREQYKQVKAHVKKDDGRMQAYGWSLPAKFNPPTNKEANSQQSKTVPVPVPVYCRPLLDKDPNTKIWCAAGINLNGGRTKDGGSMVGASVFYSNPPLQKQMKTAENEVEKLDQELKEHEKGIKSIENDATSSIVWICTTTNNSSQVTVIDANNPGDVLENFHVTTSHILCIAAVPGATESDYSFDEKDIKCEPEIKPQKSDSGISTTSDTSAHSDTKEPAEGIGGISLVQCATGTTSNEGTPVGTPPVQGAEELSAQTEKTVTDVIENLSNKDAEKDGADDEDEHGDDTTSHTEMLPQGDIEGDRITVMKARGSPATSARNTPQASPARTRVLKPAVDKDLVKDGLNQLALDNQIISEEIEKMSSVSATMWLGTQSGSVYVHSAVSNWKRCLHSVKLKDAVLGISHVKGRVFVALADGTVAIFHRAADGLWDLLNYHIVDLGKPHHSVRCMCVVANRYVWCGYRNKIHVLEPRNYSVKRSFDAHPRKESQIRQMAWVGDGVWISIRLDSTLRLYHAYTHQHLQDVDIEPYVSKMLGTGKLGFSFIRITSLLVSCNRLWIGTGNGVVISVPLSEANKQTVTQSSSGRPGGVIRVYSDSKGDGVTPGSFIPYCSMAQAQLSFHGHRDAVKFFVAVPGSVRDTTGAPARSVSGVIKSQDEEEKKDTKSDKGKTMLVISGGEGYIDFRLGDTDEEAENNEEEKKTVSSAAKGDRSHLIVWQVYNNKSAQS